MKPYYEKYLFYGGIKWEKVVLLLKKGATLTQNVILKVIRTLVIIKEYIGTYLL